MQVYAITFLVLTLIGTGIKIGEGKPGYILDMLAVIPIIGRVLGWW
jgi:hypothetical protein